MYRLIITYSLVGLFFSNARTMLLNGVSQLLWRPR